MVFLKVDSDHNIATGLPPPKKINIHEREKGGGRKGRERKGRREKQHISHDI